MERYQHSMRLGQGLTIGTKTYFEALELMFHKRLRWFLLIPVLLNILLLIGGYALIGDFADWLSVHLKKWTKMETWEFWGSSYSGSVLEFIVNLILRLLFFLLIAYYGGFVIIMILAPVFSILSERVEEIKTGKEYPFSWLQLFKDMVRGVSIALRNLCIEIVLSIFILLLGFIPVVGVLSPIMLFFLSSYFYGFSFVDYAIERRKLTIRKSIRFMRDHKGIVIANGGLFSLSLMIPCGMFLSGFIALISVVAGTLAVIKVWEKPQAPAS